MCLFTFGDYQTTAKHSKSFIATGDKNHGAHYVHGLSTAHVAIEDGVRA